ncbi:MAG: RdgB/HAM1 family non-canonical purine NTP pyrophosphatase [Acidimicrobiia bacterium]
MTSLRVVLATNNPDKAIEISAILGDGIELVPRPGHVPDVEETEDTLEGNALLKARALVEATGVASIADDTGLEVDALGGAPGVYSARYAGENVTYADNVNKLLSQLALHQGAPRTARFRTVAVAVFPSGEQIVAHGTVEGVIATEARGMRGFGYDPVFIADDDGQGRTFAQMSAAEKNALSHRGRAFRALAEALAARPHD